MKTIPCTRDFLSRLICVLLIEAVFMWATRVTVSHLSALSYEAESIRTLLRIATATLDWWLLRPLILSRTPNLSSLRRVPLIAGIAVSLGINLLPFMNSSLSPPLSTYFALTSIAVAIKEEFLFRGIIQNLLVEVIGVRGGLLVASLLFVAFHIGVTNPSIWNYFWIFTIGVTYGLVYLRSGSIAAPIVLHFIEDAMVSFTPFTTPTGSPFLYEWSGLLAWGMPVMSLGLITVWARKALASALQKC